MSPCVKTPLLPQYTADAREHIGTRHRRFPSPEDGPDSAGGTRELQIEQHNYGVESEQAGGESEDGLLAIAFGGFQFQVFTAFLECRFDGPPLRVTRHHLLRRHREIGRKEILVAMGPCTIMG
jgi:hypothetical protein